MKNYNGTKKIVFIMITLMALMILGQWTFVGCKCKTEKINIEDATREAKEELKDSLEDDD